MKKTVLLAILVLQCFSSNSYSQVPDVGYYWWGPKAQLNTSALQNICLVWTGSSCTNWVSWSGNVGSAGSLYIGSTNMTGGLGPNGEGVIVVVNSYWPTIPYTGAAAGVTAGGAQCITWTGGAPVVNGNCNKTTARPVLAYNYLNDLYFDNRYDPMAMANWIDFGYRVVIHEFGHVLGMGHNNNVLINSFMQDPITTTTATTLHSVEITWINTNII